MNASFSGIFGPAHEAPRYALLGAPYDAGSSYRPGARLAPRSIRELAASLNACTEAGVDLGALPAVDRGDLELNNRVESAFRNVEAAVGLVLDTGAVPLLLGGDHSVTLPAFRAALARHPDLALLTLDAHPDLYPDYAGDPYSHACVTSRILELDGMRGERVTQVGIRASTGAQRAAAERAGVVTVPVGDAPGFVYERAAPVYLSLDIDVLDPAYAPGCGNPVPGGLSSRELFAILRAINAPVVGFDLVEVNPLCDPSGVTSLAAARAVIELLGALEADRSDRSAFS